MNTPLLIEPDELALLIESAKLQDVVVVDCRFRLDDKEAGRRAYAKGHIAGAAYADLEKDLSSSPSGRGGRHPLPSVDAFAQFLQTIGVGPSTYVVAYDDGGEMAARLWWLLRYYSHDRVSVLQGGIAAWQEAGYPLVTQIPSPQPARENLLLHERRDWLVTRQEVQARTALPTSDLWLLDSRAIARFRGEVEPIDPRAGHIPGAHCYFWGDALAGPAKYKTEAELRRHFAGLPDVPVVYCGSGVTACVNVLALHLIGVPARLYAGSFSDWCSEAANEIVVGDAER